ncbi:MAG: hypothetical protein ABJB85_06805 [Nitrososphaerota archaeon]
MIIDTILSQQYNVPLSGSEIVPLHKDIQSTRTRKYITHQKVSLLAKEKLITGITYAEVMFKFLCSKKQAQRKLKNAHFDHVLFTAQDLISQGLKLPPSFRNKRPQRYYAAASRADIIEKLNEQYKNVLLQTTYTQYSGDPMSSCLESQKASTFLEFLQLLPDSVRYIHKMRKCSLLEWE